MIYWIYSIQYQRFLRKFFREERLPTKTRRQLYGGGLEYGAVGDFSTGGGNCVWED